jgi:hypothetical protein
VNDVINLRADKPKAQTPVMTGITVTVVVIPTSKFSVYSVCDDLDVKFPSSRGQNGYSVDGEGTNLKAIQQMQSNLEYCGFCIRRNILSPLGMKQLRSKLLPLVNVLQSSYNNHDDEFGELNCEKYGIVRYPRIGKGENKLLVGCIHTIVSLRRRKA